MTLFVGSCAALQAVVAIYDRDSSDRNGRVGGISDLADDGAGGFALRQGFGRAEWRSNGQQKNRENGARDDGVSRFLDSAGPRAMSRGASVAASRRIDEATLTILNIVNIESTV